MEQLSGPPSHTPEPDELAQKLADFFAGNPDAKLGHDDRGAFIASPWGDPSVEIRLQEDAERVVSALNAVTLAPPLIAMWHRDTKDLEIIWSPVSEGRDERSRSYEFKFRDFTYRCEFAVSSERLLTIASASRPSGTLTTTNYRNLREFAWYERRRKREPQGKFVMTTFPTCFWIRGIEWEEGSVIELIRHLNFYNRYFDRRHPQIIVQGEVSPQAKTGSPLRYPFGEFPARIIGKQLDPYLLSLWDAVTSAPDPFRAYIYSYQILEYAAFYYLSEGVTQTVRRILAAPEVAIRPEQAARQILDALADFKAADDEKIVAVVRQVVDPAILWREIQASIDAFSTDTVFEGGFSLPGLVQRQWSLEDFRTSWNPNLAHSLRKLRNALVHGREARTAKVVLPTRANYERLRPWRDLLSVIASHTILYEV